MKNFFENITVDNFKVFKDSKSIRLAPINILIGKNNSGKSTLMELMKLIKVSLDQSNLNKLMFSKLDGFQSFEDFKTFDYNKEIIKLRIPFQLNWFIKTPINESHYLKDTGMKEKSHDKSKFFLSLEYKNSSTNRLDGILYKYEITDYNGDVIYKTLRQDIEGENEFINTKFYINYKKITEWVDDFYNWKIEYLEELKDELVQSDIFKSDKKETDSIDEIFKSIHDEKSIMNNLVMEKQGFFQTSPKDIEEWSSTDHLTDNPEKYEGYTYRFDEYSILEYAHNRKEIVKESLLDKNLLGDFSLPMWRTIKESSLLFEYDNEDGSPISKQQIKQIREIEEKLLEKEYPLKLSKDNFYERIFNLEIIPSYVIDEIKKIGNIRLIINRDYNTDEAFLSMTSYGIFIRNIINDLGSIPKNVIDSSLINTSDVDTIKDDMTTFLKTTYNNPLEDYQNNFVNKWIKAFTYTDNSGYEIKRVGNELKIYFNDSKTSIDSYGKGLQELIYLIFNIAKQTKDKESIMLIVEPEAHLHPNFQSLLADMFVDASKEFNIKFIIESHSEYLVKKFQYLTIKGDIKQGEDISEFNDKGEFVEKQSYGDVIINYFENNNRENCTVVNQIFIDEYGNLSDNLGEGFTDHTPKLMMDILSIKNKK
jgi:predicted ATPase